MGIHIHTYRTPSSRVAFALLPRLLSKSSNTYHSSNKACCPTWSFDHRSTLLSPLSTLFRSLLGLVSSPFSAALLLFSLSRSASFSEHIESTRPATLSAASRYWLSLCMPSANASTAGPILRCNELRRLEMLADVSWVVWSDRHRAASVSSSRDVSRSAGSDSLISGMLGGRKCSSSAFFSTRNLFSLAWSF